MFKNERILFTALAVLVVAFQAQAQDFWGITGSAENLTGTVVSSSQFNIGQSIQFSGGPFSFQTTGQESVALCPYACPASGQLTIGGTTLALSSESGGAIPISAFASSQQVQTSLSALSNQIVQMNQALKITAWSGAALASALTPIRPQEGYSNHLNIGVADAGGQVAFSINYARVQGDIDFEFGAASTGRYSLAKLGMG